MKRTLRFKKIIELLRTCRDKEEFKSAYAKEFPEKAKHVPLNDPEGMLAEELTASINTDILSELIWLGREDYINGLREDKLKRILGEE